MKKMIWVIVLVIAVVAAYFLMTKNSVPYISLQNSSSPVPSSSPIKSVYNYNKTKSKATPISSANPANPTSSYTELMKQYADRLIQFDENCQPAPATPTYKNNSSILLDNRSASPKTIFVGETKYQLAAYGYKVISLSSSSLPKELPVACGSNGNVGKILLQARMFGY